jgi:hypothetical protein
LKTLFNFEGDYIMAKKGGKSKGFISQGIHSNVSAGTLNAIRREQDPSVKALNIQRAWLRGQNPWMTIDNPSKEQTNKRKIRVRANDVLGHPKERAKKLFQMPGA